MSHASVAQTFRTLGIVLDSEKDLAEVNDTMVKRLYRKLALKLHPDKNKTDPNAEAKFNQLKLAHDVLMNETTRIEHVEVMRGLLQRKKEQASRNLEKQKFAQELERRETQPQDQSGAQNDLKSIRARHAMLIEIFQQRRGPQTSRDSPYPAPDDSNMDLQYWLNYGLKEPEDVRSEKQKRFKSHIDQQLRQAGQPVGIS